MATKKKVRAKKSPAKKTSAKTIAKKAIAKKAIAKKAIATGTKKRVAKKSAAKKSAAKSAATSASVVAKVSPLRGVDVGEWVESLQPAWMKKLTARLVGLVRKHVPEATVSMKWSRPVFEVSGPFAWIMPATSHVTFGFWRGADLTDADAYLAGSGAKMRHLKITPSAPADERMIIAWLKEAAALNVKLGDPTKR